MGHPRSNIHSLLERDAELSLFEARLTEAAESRGGLVLVEGPAGIGKSALLSAVADRASALGFATLRARGGQLERAFAYGVVRQLFEPALATAPASVRAELFAGAAELAAPLLHPSAPRAASPFSDSLEADALFGALHGLFWLTANLAERRPILLLVDDLHWCDAPSLRFLAYLTRRLDGLAVLFAGALRQDEAIADQAPLNELRTDPLSTPIRLTPLSPMAFSGLIEDALGAPDTAFVAALYRACAGNPLLLRELLRSLGTAGVPPRAEAIDTALAVGVSSVAELIGRRLAPVGPDALALARALAVLGDDSDPRLAAALADLAPELADMAAEALAHADVLGPWRQLRFTHPLVREAVYAGLAKVTRARLHRRAAEFLRVRGAPPAAIAAHLVVSTEELNADAIATLREAARRAVSQGAADAAVAYLQRALAEPLVDDRSELLLELARAETRADPAAAVIHLEEALRLTPGAKRRATVALDLGQALLALGRGAEAVGVLDDALTQLGGLAGDLTHRLNAELIAQARFEPTLYLDARRRLTEVGEVEGEGVGARYLMALHASELARGGEDPERAEALARRALSGGWPIEEAWIPFIAAQVLVHLDQFDSARRVYDEALARAQRSGSAFSFALATAFRSQVAFRTGNVGGAEADARSAVETALTHGLGWLRAMAVGYLAEVQAERGELAEALRTLDLAEAGEAVGGTFQLNLFRNARGRLRVAAGLIREGLADFLAVGTYFEALGMRNPSQVPWRSEAALALRALGDVDEAHRLATEELVVARSWGAPRALGAALWALGLVEGGDRGVGHLRAAVAALAHSPARLDRARALGELGAALRRANQRGEARGYLEASLELADRCGASALAERVRAELVATGARPRRAARTGPDALTPSERRVAELAADGQTNREIAQALFVTPRAIEAHLSSAYRKLEIGSRAQLARVLRSDS